MFRFPADQGDSGVRKMLPCGCTSSLGLLSEPLSVSPTHPDTRCTQPAGTPLGCWASPSPWRPKPPSSGESGFPSCSSCSSAHLHAPSVSSSSELVELKIEEFLQIFGNRLSSMSCDAFRSQVRALIQLKQCEEAHLGEEVERHWFEVVTQQYVFTRLSKEVRRAHIESEAVEPAPFLDLQLTVPEAGPGSDPGPSSVLVLILVVICCLCSFCRWSS